MLMVQFDIIPFERSDNRKNKMKKILFFRAIELNLSFSIEINSLKIENINDRFSFEKNKLNNFSRIK